MYYKTFYGRINLESLSLYVNSTIAFLFDSKVGAYLSGAPYGTPLS